MPTVLERRRSLRGVVVPVGLAAVALLAVMAGLRVYCGSFPAAIAYLAGDRLLVDASSKTVGDVAIGERASVAFTLCNRSAAPVTILGVKTSCTCTATGDLPMTLPPSSSRTLAVTYSPRPSAKPGQVLETMQLFTDSRAQPTMPLAIVGRVGPVRAGASQPPAPAKGH